MSLQRPDGPPVDAVSSASFVLVKSSNAGRARRGLPEAIKALRDQKVRLVAELNVHELARLDRILSANACNRMVVVAAGGDGTVGAVAQVLLGAGAVLGVLPLGNSNDFARSLSIPLDIQAAVHTLLSGRTNQIDVGRVLSEGRPQMHFVHAATAGLNVDFARLATRPSFRDRLGRFTYVGAAARAIRESRSFRAVLDVDGRSAQLQLMQLAIVNTSVFGGSLRMRVPRVRTDDGLLDVVAVGAVPLRSAAEALRRGVRPAAPPPSGIALFRGRHVRVRTDRPLGVALDGEVVAALPATFAVSEHRLQVITGCLSRTYEGREVSR